MRNARKAGPAKRRLFIEGLERRELLAGNVLVEVTSGLLRVTGDANDNQITIFQQTNGQFTISGLDSEVFTGPTAGIVARNITVNLGAGDDSVVIAAQSVEESVDLLPASVLGTTTVNGGDGSDTISVSVIGRQAGMLVLPALAISIDGGAPAAGSESPQDDAVLITNSSATLVTVRTGVGDDSIDLTNVLALTLNVESGGSTTTNGFTDTDLVSATNLTALTATVNLGQNSSGNFLSIDTGIFGTLTARGGNGVDNVNLANTLAGLSLSLSTYGGADIVNLSTVQTGLTSADYQDIANLVIEAFDINLSSLPFNLFTLISKLPSFPGSMTVSTGDGADIVTANDLYSTMAIYIYLDAGDDQLFANNVESDFFAWFFGGAGTDGRLITNVSALSELELQFESTLTGGTQGGST